MFEKHQGGREFRQIQTVPGWKDTEDDTGLLDTLFAANGTSKRYQAGETIFVEGYDTHTVYQIRTGTVRICILTPDGRRQISRFVTSGGVLGLIAQYSQDCLVEAVNEVELLHCPRKLLDANISIDEILRDEVQQIIVDELVASRKHILMLGRLTAAERAASFLLGLTGSAGLGSKDGFIKVPMSRQDIADHLGLTIETVSRTINALKRSGLIEMPAPDQVRITDFAGLNRLANQV